jgi:hypothetical protein
VNKLTRRAFLWRGSVVAGVAGAVAAVPGLPAFLAADSPTLTSAADTTGPEAASAVSEDATLTEPLVVHVKDLTTGAMDLFIGTQQIAYTNPQLAGRLFQATR